MGRFVVLALGVFVLVPVVMLVSYLFPSIRRQHIAEMGAFVLAVLVAVFVFRRPRRRQR